MPRSKRDFDLTILSNKIDIVLDLWNSNQMSKNIDELQSAGFDYKMTRCIGFVDLATIVFRVKPGSPPMFLHFTCFTPCVWLAVIASIVTISLVLSYVRKCLIGLLEFSWNLTLIMFTKSIDEINKLEADLVLRFLVALWLICALIISTQFTSFLLDYMTWTNPVVRIDSLQEVVDTPNIKVYAAVDSPLVHYTQDDSDPLAVALRKKIIAHKREAWINKTFIRDMVFKLKSGSYGFSYHKMSAIFQIANLLTKAEDENSKEKISQILHISRDSGGSLPNALAVSGDNPVIIKALNRM